MPDWLVGILVGGAGGGLLGYFGRGWIDEHFSRRKEQRQIRQTDLRAMRDDLLAFLGEPRSHFTWLKSVRDARTAGGIPSPDEKAQIIAGWVYKNVMRYPEHIRGRMYLIANITYQLARGDRHFLETDVGPTAVEEAWTALDHYTQELTRDLHGSP